MKHTLIGLATLAAFSSANADVTPYATLDLAVSNTTKTGQPDDGLQLVGSGTNYGTSFFGVKGSTDLGEGMKVSGQLEAGFDSQSTQSFTGGAWGRVAKVVLEGDFGALQLGTDWSPYDTAIAMTDAMDAQHFSSMNNGGAWDQGVHADLGNNSADGTTHNTIQYTTPTVGGFNGVIMYGPKKVATSATTNTDASYLGWGVNYANGPIAVSLAAERVPASVFNTSAVAGTAMTNAWVLGGTYDLGFASLYAGMGEAKAEFNGTSTGSAKDTGQAFGVKIPRGDLTISAGWARETTTEANVADKTANSFSVQALYALNQMATVYVGGRNLVTNTTGTDVTTSVISVGLRLAF